MAERIKHGSQDMPTPETLVPPELLDSYEINPDSGYVGIAIQGDNGSGTTVLKKALAAIIKGTGSHEGGTTMREKAGATSSDIGVQKLTVEDDIEHDKRQLEKMDSATAENPLINESHLSGLIAKKSKKKFIVFNLTAPAKIRMKRVQDRKLRDIKWYQRRAQVDEAYSKGLLSKKEKKDQIRLLSYERNKYSLGKITRAERNRRKEDIARWTQAHPELAGQDPANPGTMINNEHLGDFNISTGNLTQDDVQRLVLTILYEKDIIRPVGEQKKSSSREDNNPNEVVLISN